MFKGIIILQHNKQNVSISTAIWLVIFYEIIKQQKTAAYYNIYGPTLFTHLPQASICISRSVYMMRGPTKKLVFYSIK